ncbi:hypothetical protein LRS06_17070 [Hymenobacter sp. J193]|uniref:hypothetical protein n=1 Tax=Hymenobacter sp. J193 TaxID=2898429 RepID=UPI0021514C47|nr:hypothetical protein [Hymenobacter sp. J193]MCR5889450.1 hypothetical protein [Hymenobacter sp. J193]
MMDTTNSARALRGPHPIAPATVRPGNHPPRPPQPPRRRNPFPAPVPNGPFQAALLYRLETSSYIANLNGMDWEYRLVAECVPTAASITVHPLLYLCRPQSRYTRPSQCEGILQSPTIEGVKEFLSGLRMVELSPVARDFFDIAFVLDYKENYRLRNIAAPAAVALIRKPTAHQEGYMLLLVLPQNYQPRYRSANERTAAAAMRAAVSYVPAWLKYLSGSAPA